MPVTPSDPRHTPWHLLGAGAIGTLFAHRLTTAGCEVRLLSRNTGPLERTLGLETQGSLSERTFPVSAIAEETPIERLLVTTKAAEVDPALATISHRLHADTTIVVLANGMGFADALPRGLAVYRGSTTEGAFRRSHCQTVHAGRGETRIGLPGVAIAPPPWFIDSWGRLEGSLWDRDINATLWRKLAINCVINPLTAVHLCRNGELAEPRHRQTLLALCSEVTSACRAAGHAAAVTSLFDDVLAVIRHTATNRSSMLQDVLQGRQTEIDFINGFLLGQAAASALDLPLSHSLVAAVKAMQQGNNAPR